MQAVGTFETILVGVLVVALLLWFGPGIRRSMQMTREAENPDWHGFLVPILLVAAFVLFLIWAT